MNYPVKIQYRTDENNWLLTIPDIQGCTVEGKSISDTLKQADHAIADHLAILAEYGEKIPTASDIENFISTSPMANIVWAVIDVDIVPYLGKSHKINVTLPELLIKQIDDRVSKSEQYKTRSGFIATACMTELTNK
ncbi:MULTISPECIES: type II toxin-antitoxin system HicB family antitoxin [Thalassotalea]|uniref:type II toxin-antitoxin system HicB family antitoxin n=1 Tax=Thalassotalea TaxID=1518149 RepID=UPI00094421D4|nr:MULTISPECIES: type II toxin-antitoxin system HicB family antitoxin [Thalassotalea]OKY25811.1 HicB family protein [Thalassotalea sp. PP2-459]